MARIDNKPDITHNHLKIKEESYERKKDFISFLASIQSYLNCSGFDECALKVRKMEADDERKRKAEHAVMEYALSEAQKRAQVEPHVLYPTPNISTAHVLIPLLPSATPKPHWKDYLFPDIIVAGLPKAGTSQLWFVIKAHRQTASFNGMAEDCFATRFQIAENYSDVQRDKLQTGLYDYFARRDKQRVKRALQLGLKTISNCHGVDDIILRASYLQTTKTPRILFLIRDPAEWLWAAWNYWVNPHFDAGEYYPGQWTDLHRNYRSPDLFHEFISSGMRTIPGQKLIERRVRSVENVRKLTAAFGDNSIFLARSEDMLPAVIDAPGGFLDKLANFTGLSRDGFPDHSLKTLRNCNDNKGNEKPCGDSKRTGYAISGGREMRKETRTLIYLYFHEECKIWEREFGLVFPDCLDSLSDKA